MKAVRLGDIVLFVRNGKSVKQGSSQAGLPITRIETIADGEINPDKVGFADLGVEGNEEWLLKDGDILISHINSTKHLGKCAQYSGHPGQIIHGMNLLNLRCNQEKAFPRYVLHFLKSETFLRQIPRITKNSVNQSSFTVSAFKELVVYLPPLPEQKRIAAILDKADEIRRKREKAIDLTDSFLRSVFLEMFGDLSSNSRHWRLERLGDHIEHANNGLSRRRKTFENEGNIVLRLQDVRDGHIKLDSPNRISLDEQEKRRFGLISGDLVFIRVNGNRQYVGRSAVFRGFAEDVYHNDHIIRLRLKESLEGEFLCYLFNSLFGKRLLSNHIKTSAGQHTICQEGIFSITFAVPPIELQRSFAFKLKQLNSLRQRYQRCLDLSLNLHQSLENGIFSKLPLSKKEISIQEAAHAL